MGLPPNSAAPFLGSATRSLPEVDDREPHRQLVGARLAVGELVLQEGAAQEAVSRGDARGATCPS